MRSARRIVLLVLTWAAVAACAEPAGLPVGLAPTVARSSPAPTAAPATLPPGAPAGPFLADGQQSGGLQVWLSSTPAQPLVGTAAVDAYVAGSDGQPVSGAKVTFDTDMTNMSHGPYLVAADPGAAGHYQGQVHFSMPGPWRIITVIERAGAPTVRLRFEFRISR
jgi:hypothetical protein